MQQSEKNEIKEQILFKSLIGNDIKIIESKNKNQLNLEGKLVYETAKFLHILKNGSIIKIYKENVQFETILKGKALKVNGRLLIGTLTQRIKKNK